VRWRCDQVGDCRSASGNLQMGEPRRLRLSSPAVKWRKCWRGCMEDLPEDTSELIRHSTRSNSGITGYTWGTTSKVGVNSVTPAQLAEAPEQGPGTWYTSTTSGHLLSGSPWKSLDPSHRATRKTGIFWLPWTTLLSGRRFTLSLTKRRRQWRTPWWLTSSASLEFRENCIATRATTSNLGSCKRCWHA
jgi:hypothetical protein